MLPKACFFKGSKTGYCLLIFLPLGSYLSSTPGNESHLVKRVHQLFERMHKTKEALNIAPHPKQ